MNSKNIGFFLILASIFGTISITSVFAAMTNFKEQKAGYELQEGKFYSNGNGNAGYINITSAGFDGVLLKGNITLQSVGGGNFLPNTVIVPPPGKNPTRTCWMLSGYIVTKNAGKIELSGVNTKLRYNPVTRQLEGYGYNRNLAKVWLGMDKYCLDNLEEDKDPKDLQIGIIDDQELGDIIKQGKRPGDQSAFIGKVKILGNIGNNDAIFGRVYTAEGGLEFSGYNRSLQEIRKNIAILSRNLTDNYKNNFQVEIEQVKILNGVIFYINDEKTSKTVKISKIPDNVRSIIVVGGDAIIENDLKDTIRPVPRAIISIQNKHDIGGNIYIKKNVKTIHASLVAERSLYSGEGEGDKKKLYNDDPAEIANLPKNQLYIFGVLFSRNTIGGASKDVNSPKCPYNITCTPINAPQYDLNYFRVFDKKDVNKNNQRAYKDEILDDYSMIIEYNPQIRQNPPPGLDIVR